MDGPHLVVALLFLVILGTITWRVVRCEFARRMALVGSEAVQELDRAGTPAEADDCVSEAA